MTTSAVWGLTSAVLLLGGIALAGTCLVTGVFNGLGLLAVLGFLGFIGITVWRGDE